MSLKEQKQKNDKEEKHISENHKIVSQSEWMEARKDLLSKEKEFTILRDQLNQERRDLPWVQVNKEYVFDGSDGKQTLSELFDGRSQLIIFILCLVQVGMQDVQAVPFGPTTSIK